MSKLIQTVMLTLIVLGAIIETTTAHPARELGVSLVAYPSISEDEQDGFCAQYEDEFDGVSEICGGDV